MRLRYLYAAVVLVFVGAAGWRATHKPPEAVVKPTSVIVSTSSIKKPTPPRPPGPSEPTPEEIARLGSADRIVRLQGADLLLTRKPTADLIAAVEKARVDYKADAAMIERLSCMKVNFPDRASLDFAYSLLPADEHGFGSNMPREARCALKAVADRVAEDPVRARTALLPAALSAHFESNQPALKGLERTPVADFPPFLQVEVHSPDVDRRHRAVKAALALHATDLIPGLVERALLDDARSVRDAVRVHLEYSMSPNAPRIIAYGVVRAPDDYWMDDLFGKREATRHDATPPLLDIAEDSGADMAHRLAAIQMISKRGDTKVALPRLHTLRDASSGAFRARIEEAIVAMEKRYGPPQLR